MEDVADVLTVHMQSNNCQGIVDCIVHMNSHNASCVYKAKVVLLYRDLFNNLWKFIAGKGNMVMIDGVRRPLRDIINAHLKPFFDNCVGVEEFIRHSVTKMFLFFIQGITLFRQDGENITGRPIYHRTASCGPKGTSKTLDLEYKNNNLSCLGVKEADELRRRMRNVWNCHLERSIYDILYSTYFTSQDSGHILQKNNVERKLFESCFPMIHMSIINIFISKWDGNVPLELTLKYSKQVEGYKERGIVTEKYMRKHLGNGLYTVDVFCERIMAYPDGKKRAWTKVSSFQNKNVDWIAQHNAPLFGIDPWTVKTIKMKTALVLTWL